MAKISSAKPSASSSTKSKKPAADKNAAPEAKAPAPSKSLKRKKEVVAEAAKPTEEAVVEPSPKKSKTDKAASPAKVVPAHAPVSARPALGPIPTFPKIDKKSKKSADKAKTSHSRTKQRSPEPMISSKAEETSKESKAAPKKNKFEVQKAKPVIEEKEEAPAPVETEVEAEAEDEDGDEETYLHGFSTDEDSSDEDDDDMNVDPSAFDVGSLPTIAKDDATVKKKLDKAKRQPTGDRGVLYLGRIPHGFYEEQMKAYFGQFGEVTRVRLSRNKKSGKSKHYGFVEFDSASVAKIVAETMDNYLLHGHILQCKLIPKDKIHPQLWVGANRKWRTVPVDQLTRATHNKKRTEGERDAASKRLIRRQTQRKRKLEEFGINYNFDAVGYKKAERVVELSK